MKALSTILAITLSLTLPAKFTHAQVADDEQLHQSLISQASDQGSVAVIIEFDLDIEPLSGNLRSKVVDQRQQIQDVSQLMLSQMQSYALRNVKQYRNIPVMAATVDEAALARLLEDENVRRIHRDELSDPLMDSSPGVVGATEAWTAGYTGAGQTLAILDTGMDISHPFYSGRIVAEACFSSSNEGVGSESLCPSGEEEEFGPGSANSCESDLAGCSHGTSVGGIAAGNGDDLSGIAPGADIISIQVFSKLPAEECGGDDSCVRSFVSDQIKALDWLYDQTDELNLVAANMSLGAGQYETYCDDDVRKPIIDQLRASNVATVVASGNDGHTNALGSPACISSAISVGSTNPGTLDESKQDEVSMFSNSTDFLDLLAPGQDIRTSISGGNFSYFVQGTSFAAPHVTGAWALMRQAQPEATVTEVLDQLQTTGWPVKDHRNGFITSRIQVDEAIMGGPVAMALSQTGITLQLPPNATATEYLNISNIGEGTLHWALQVERNVSGFSKTAGDGLLEGQILFETSFNEHEGFEPGLVSGQQGWLPIGDSQTQPQISNETPSTGSQHLLLGQDAAIGAFEQTGVQTPPFGFFESGRFTVTFDLKINSTGGSIFYVGLESLRQGEQAGGIMFHSLGDLYFQLSNGYVQGTGEWTPDEYAEVRIEVDTYEKTTHYYYDDVLVYTHENTTGTSVESLRFFRNNNADNAVHIDKIRIQGEDVLPLWVWAEAESGELSSEASEDVTIMFNSHNLEEGTHHAQLHITSNDHDNISLVAPVSLVVGESEDMVVKLEVMPSETVIEQGSSFEVDIVAGHPDQPVIDLAGAGFQINLNPDVLNVDKVTFPDFLFTNADEDDVLTFYEISEDSSYVAASATRKEAVGGVNGTGSVLRLHLTVSDDAEGDHEFELSEVLTVNSEGNQLNYELSPATVSFLEPFTVWPGDTNNDGIVDIADVLPVAQHFGQTGPPREKFNIAWQAQPATPWDQEELAYVDATGSGVINQNDIMPIGLNFGKASGDMAPPAWAASQSDEPAVDLLIPAGYDQTSLTVTLTLGSTDEPLYDILGVALDLNYPSEFMTLRDIQPGGWLDSENLMVFDHEYEDDGQNGISYSVAMSRLGEEEPARGKGDAVTLTFDMDQVLQQDVSISLQRVIASKVDGTVSEGVAHRFTSKQVTSRESDDTFPQEFELSANYPNPFNPSTNIAYALPENSDVRLDVYDLLGRHVAVLVNETKAAGRYTAVFDASGLASGVYIFQLKAGSFNQTRSMTLVK